MKKMFIIAIALAGLSADAASSILGTTAYQKPGSESVVYRGEIALPGEGMWEAVSSASGLRQVYVLPPESILAQTPGRRMQEVMKEKLNQRGRYHVQSIHWPCRDYASKHNATGPASFDDLDPKRHKHVLARVNRSPWLGERLAEEVEGPFIFLIPKVAFQFRSEKNQRVLRKDRARLAVELRPYLDDGKHWVLYTDGSCERVDIDPLLAKTYDIAIRPVLKKTAAGGAGRGKQVYKVFAVREKGGKSPLRLAFLNRLKDQKITVSWDTSKASPSGEAVWDDLKKARRIAWRRHARGSASPVMLTWIAAQGGKIDPEEPQRRGRGGETTSVLGLLGGRAAIRETLQLQVLNQARKEPGQRTIPIETLKGVTVKSHPYAEMLGTKKGGRLPLADIAPHDRFFVYVGKPKAMLPFLDQGAGFLSRTGGTMTRTAIVYDLKTRYLARLGLDEKWLKLFLKSGAVQECALMLPDLFLIDGTDLTVASRLTKPALIKPLLKLAGVGDLSGGKVVQRTVNGDRTVYWTLVEDLLLVSTNRGELDKVLALRKSGGKRSLGQSAEFKYMLTQLPTRKDTRLYLYFSDAFIRRLVGPAAKIGQLRRVIARADMEHITSCALLAKLDGMRNVTSLPDLIEHGYVPQRYAGGEYTIQKDLIARSRTYGIPQRMKTLQDLPVDKVSQWEADIYKRYVSNYSRYWRRFFDPIAVRLDDAPGGELEMTTFILPLVDNSIYNMLRGVVMTKEDKKPLSLPTVTPQPVINLSLNLKDQAWKGIAEGLSEMFTQYAHINPAVLDDLGPALHFGIHDADPVIALGSGDVMGAFSGGMLSGGGEEALFIPVLLSVLTRPCTMIIETRNPAKTRQYLRQAASNTYRPRRRRWSEFGVDFYQVGEADSWVYTMDLFGMIKLRYGLEVRDGHVIIRNIPWSSKDRVVKTVPASLNGANLSLAPGACREQLASLHASAANHERLAAVSGMAHLYPLVASGYADMKGAAGAHARLFGYKPKHPGRGAWEWKDYQVVSSTYGSVYRQRQPAHVDGDRNFGMLRDIDRVNVNMQFEQSGLRTIVRWKTRQATP